MPTDKDRSTTTLTFTGVQAAILDKRRGPLSTNEYLVTLVRRSRAEGWAHDPVDEPRQPHVFAYRSVYFTDEDLAWLDEVRGSWTRADFLAGLAERDERPEAREALHLQSETHVVAVLDVATTRWVDTNRGNKTRAEFLSGLARQAARANSTTPPTTRLDVNFFNASLGARQVKMIDALRGRTSRNVYARALVGRAFKGWDWRRTALPDGSEVGPGKTSAVTFRLSGDEIAYLGAQLPGQSRAAVVRALIASAYQEEFLTRPGVGSGDLQSIPRPGAPVGSRRRARRKIEET